MEERKVALIPHVLFQGMAGPKEYSVLLTDQRTIFVLEKSSKALVGFMLGGVIGAAIAESVATRRVIDFENMPVENLVMDPKNLAVPHGSIQRLVMKRKVAGASLRIEYTRPDGKRKKLTAIVTPRADQLKQQKRQGVRKKEARRAYVRQAKEAFERALSAAAASRAEWRL